MAETTWVSITSQPAKRKRAEIACERCHSKKIKCDLAARRNQQQPNCSNCAAGRQECRARASQRANSGRRNARAAKRAPTSTATGDNARTSISNSVHNAPGLPTGRQIFTDAVDGTHFPPLPAPLSLQASTGRHDAASSTNESPRRQSAMSLGNNVLAECSVGSTTTPMSAAADEQTYQVDTGFVYVYGPENTHDARNQEQQSKRLPDRFAELPDSNLLQSFTETYFKYCYTWCPVLDRSTVAQILPTSPMLANALALVGSHVRPPIIGQNKPELYYSQARRLFYDDKEPDVLTSMKALSLFYWWSPRPPSTVHRHSSWWWQSVIIRHCQQMGVHREPGPNSALRLELDLSIRRRIWWTAFARERLTAICQSQTCIIDPEDCNIQEPTLDDFPDGQKDKGEIFIYWVRLCAIIGRIARHIFRSMGSTSTFPTALAQQLVDWVNSLPPHLQLPINTYQTQNFNRDVHQLHMPYLAVVIILHLKRSSQPLPQAYPPAVLAATCMARIFKDILARGDTRFLMGITCWYTGTAFMALRHACRSENLRASANDELDILTVMIDQLRTMWPTGNIFYSGFQRLRSDLPTTTGDRALPPHAQLEDSVSVDAYDGGGIEWTAYFPFATSQTSDIAQQLLVAELPMNELFLADTFPDGTDLDFTSFFEPFGNFPELDTGL